MVDFTERKQAEQSELEVRKLQARQGVVNQIAHELNNPLAALMFIVPALRDLPELKGSSDALEMLRNAEQMLERIAALTRAVLAAGSTKSG
ncbi:MAG TPA: histidine kinase dimerization/phospho-acceptor domain-containing protein [Terriglobales bacterium]|nr:histidine kinase dimerization/phospho-acceptor domain-containing protein [Terriglobales bacterium]